VTSRADDDARAAGQRVGGLLAVHAHPDDETISTGALLATWAVSGAPVTVVTCTRGERGEVIPAGQADLAVDPARLAAHRELELAAALAALGVTGHVFLDQVPGSGVGGRHFTDSGMAWVGPGRAGRTEDAPDDAFVRIPLDDAAGRLADLICERRPDVVVGYEPGGGYGHPDHVQAHRVMRRGLELAAGCGPASYRVPAVLWAAVDVAALRAGRAELSADGGLTPAGPDEPAPSAAVHPGEVDVSVDVLPVLDAVMAGLRAHATQVQGVRALAVADGRAAVGCFALSNAVLQPVLRRECYRFDPDWAPAPVRWPDGVRAGIA